jgi:hypothetical protein
MCFTLTPLWLHNAIEFLFFAAISEPEWVSQQKLKSPRQPMVQPTEVKTCKWRLGRISFFCCQSIDELSSISCTASRCPGGVDIPACLGASVRASSPCSCSVLFVLLGVFGFCGYGGVHPVQYVLRQTQARCQELCVTIELYNGTRSYLRI